MGDQFDASCVGQTTRVGEWPDDLCAHVVSLDVCRAWLRHLDFFSLGLRGERARAPEFEKGHVMKKHEYRNYRMVVLNPRA